MLNLPDISLSDHAIKWYESQGIRVDKHNKAKGIRTFSNRNYLISYRNQLLLTDIVQNVFRSKIRNQDNHDSVTFNLIFGYSGKYDESIANRMLVQMIQKYFKEKGATVIQVEKPTQIKAFEIQRRHSADGTKSKAQLILDWIQSKPSGYEFAPVEARKELNMTSNEWYSAINANAKLKSIFESMKIKDGWYQVP